jgi:hypothetical protein
VAKVSEREVVVALESDSKPDWGLGRCDCKREQRHATAHLLVMVSVTKRLLWIWVTAYRGELLDAMRL